MMISIRFPTPVALCPALCPALFATLIAALCLPAPVAGAGGIDPKGPRFSYDIVNTGAFQFTNAHDLLIDDGYAYLATDDGLIIIDINAAIGLPQVGFNDQLDFYDRDLAVHNGYLYANDGDNMSIWNIEDPTDPWFVRLYTPDRGSVVLPMTDNNLMGAGRNVIDINFPYAPARNAYLTDSGSFLCSLGNNLLLSQHLVVWDLSSPFDPVPLNDPPLGNLYTDQIVTEGDFIYARDGDDFTVLHQSTPASFQVMGSFTVSNATDFAVRGSMLTVLAPDTLRFYDLSNPNLPTLIGEITQIGDLGAPQTFQWHDGMLFATTDLGVLLALEIHTNPVGTHLTLDEALETKVIDNLALVADNAAGLQIFDITDPTRPALRSTYPTPNTAIAVDAVPGLAFVAMHQAGLDIVNISDPDHPALLTHFDTPRTVRDVKIVGDLAYLVDRIYGLYILDISDPANPAVLSVTDTPGLAERVTIAGTLAIVAHGTYDTQIIDISDPGHPAIVSSIPPSINKVGVLQTAMQGDLLYVADRTSGYRVFDLGNPDAPMLLGSFNPVITGETSSVRALLPMGNLLYVANWSFGLTTLDNSDPLNPRIIANYPSSGDALNLTKRDNLMFISAGDGGLQIYDTTNGAAPCQADLNSDGVLDFSDLSLFLTAFANQDLLADLNNDGVYNYFDVSLIFNLFTAGCP